MKPVPVRVLFCGRPAYGHLYPLMPLAGAAREAGHDVVFATGEDFVPRLQTLGFETHRAGPSMDEAAAEVLRDDPAAPTADGRPNWEIGGRVVFDVLARRTADDLLPLLDRIDPQLVVFEESDIGAVVAASLAGIPTICHTLGRAVPPAVVEQVTGTRAAELWAHYGKTLVPPEALRGQARLDICPPSLQEPSAFEQAGRLPMRPVPWSEPTAVPPTLDDNRSRPLVYLTLATMQRSIEVLRAAIAGLSTLDVDVLVALGPLDGSQLGEVPPEVRVERFVDQAGLLPNVDLVVHHGGSATMLGALSAGLPQLLLPSGADQFFDGDVIEAARLGLVLEPLAVSRDAIAEAATALLTDCSYRDAVASVRREIGAMPHPKEVLPDVVRLAEITL